MTIKMNGPRPQRSGYPQYPGFLGLNQQPFNQQCKVNSTTYTPNNHEKAAFYLLAELQGYGREGSGSLRGDNGIINALCNFYKGLF